MQETDTFQCPECGYELEGPECAISMTIDCPNCRRDVTVYKHN